MPALERTLREAEPLTEALHTFFPELNPILSYMNFHQQTIAGVHHERRRRPRGRLRDRASAARPRSASPRDSRNFQAYPWGEAPPDWARGNAYLQPNALQPRAVPRRHGELQLPRRGERKYAEDALKPGQDHDDKRAPCFEVPPSLYDGKLFSFPRKGVAPLREAPRGNAGNPPARRPRPERLEIRDNPAMPFLFERAYRRMGKHYFLLYVVFEFVSAFVVCLATVGPVRALHRPVERRVLDDRGRSPRRAWRSARRS